MLKNLKLSLKLGLVFAALFVLNASSYWLSSRSIADMQSDAATLNLSGIQRMNAERMLRLAQHVPRGSSEVREELRQTMRTFERNLQLLQEGNHVIQAPARDSKAGIQLAERVESNWGIVRETLNAILASTDPQETARLIDSLKVQYDAWSGEINRFVTIVQEQSTGKVRHLERFELAIMFVNLLVVALASWAVIRFITRPISRLTDKMNRLAEGSYRFEPLTVDRSDEIGLLTNSFNSMLQNWSIRRDVAATGEMQRRLLPEPFENDWVNVSIVYEPSHFVSGDFVDYIWDDERKRLFGFVIDIMGHGMTSAVQFGAIRVLLRQHGDRDEPLSERLAKINEEAARYFADDSFAAAFVFELDRSGRLTFAGAGITHFIVYRQGRASFVKSPGSVLGMFEQAEYEQQSLLLEPGDGCVFASDGMLELIPKEEAQAGDFRPYADSLKRFAKQAANRDDASAICVQWRHSQHEVTQERAPHE